MKEKLVIITNFHNRIEEFLLSTGLDQDWVPFFLGFTMLVLLFLICWIALWATKSVVLKVLRNLFLRTKNTWDDVLIEHKVLDNLAHVVPVVLIKLLAPVMFAGYPDLTAVVLKMADVYIAMVAMWVILSGLRGGEAAVSNTEAFRDKPVASYFQLGRLILYIATGIIILSILLGKSPVYFLSAFGAMTAIILLIFKDTILGLVASVQISSNDMVRVGDWVEMPKFNADGDVIAINLNTVKIRNWDKTVTTVPTYFFITDSFKNWRGMTESGGRRIKRSISVNMQTVKFVDAAMLERFKGVDLIRDFLSRRQLEIMEHNARHQVNANVLINGRRMTNIGVFRFYIEAYLKKHPGIKQDMTVMVRQLAPVSNGLPIEVYCFTNTTSWLDYESIQSDIFDHLIAAISYFDLEIFQDPAGSDISRIGSVHSGKLN